LRAAAINRLLQQNRQLTDEQLDEAIAMIEEMIARKAGNRATVIEGEAEVVPGLPAPGSGGTKMPKD
jgi:hypothetical protein